MKKLITIIGCLLCGTALFAKDYTVTSPSGNLEMTVSTGATTTWALKIKGQTVSEGNRIALELSSGRVLGNDSAKASARKDAMQETIPVLFYRCSSIDSKYNLLTLRLKDYSMEFRAYDEGVAYRFVSAAKDSLTIKDETVQFNVSRTPSRVVIDIKKSNDYAYESSFEAEYTDLNPEQFAALGDFDPTVPKGTHSFLPLFIQEGELGDVILMESDLLDYPGIFLRHSSEGFYATFPKRTKEFEWSKRYNKHRTAFEENIAVVPGKFNFPWRIVGWAAEDKYIPTNNMVYSLAAPNRLEDVSWIKPGITTWDWWNGFMLTGVDFRSGINTDFYKYHIDFAAANGIPYVLMDEGWYKAPDMFNTIDAVDLPEILRYASSKGVGIWLWGTAHLVQYCGIEAICDKYAKMGVAGFKLDFIDGQDQESVRLLTDISACAAKHHLLLDFHGIYKPAGLCRTYPNVLNFEGVFGLEMVAKDMPLHDTYLPYMRQPQGPMDYTPGSMLTVGSIPYQMARRGLLRQGTRAHQVALYFVFDSPFEMMCDSPSRYEAEPETTSYIASLPTVFDESFVQSGKIGESIVMVRRSGEKWYVGGITNSQERDIEVDFSFLGEGEWNAKLFRDGINADRNGLDYKLENVTVDAATRKNLHLAPGGGFSIVLERK